MNFHPTEKNIRFFRKHDVLSVFRISILNKDIIVHFMTAPHFPKNVMILKITGNANELNAETIENSETERIDQE